MVFAFLSENQQFNCSKLNCEWKLISVIGAKCYVQIAQQKKIVDREEYQLSCPWQEMLDVLKNINFLAWMFHKYSKTN